MNTPSILLQEQLPHGNAMFPFMIHEVSLEDIQVTGGYVDVL